jgi:hypothetical protein
MPARPRTSTWTMLYAQAAQIDRADRPNILLQAGWAGYDRPDKSVDAFPHEEFFFLSEVHE